MSLNDELREMLEVELLTRLMRADAKEWRKRLYFAIPARRLARSTQNSATLCADHDASPTRGVKRRRHDDRTRSS